MPAYLRVPLAAMAASAAAGPSTLLVLILFSLSDPQLRTESAFSILGLIPMAVVFGIAISLVPNLLGTAIMFLLSRRYPVARRRGMWAAAGALGALLLVPLWNFGGEDDLLSALSLALVGACCADICHLIAAPD
jgi:hypothetical protein